MSGWERKAGVETRATILCFVASQILQRCVLFQFKILFCALFLLMLYTGLLLWGWLEAYVSNKLIKIYLECVNRCSEVDKTLFEC